MEGFTKTLTGLRFARSLRTGIRTASSWMAKPPLQVGFVGAPFCGGQVIWPPLSQCRTITDLLRPFFLRNTAGLRTVPTWWGAPHCSRSFKKLVRHLCPLWSFVSLSWWHNKFAGHAVHDEGDVVHTLAERSGGTKTEPAKNFFENLRYNSRVC